MPKLPLNLGLAVTELSAIRRFRGGITSGGLSVEFMLFYRCTQQSLQDSEDNSYSPSTSSALFAVAIVMLHSCRSGSASESV